MSITQFVMVEELASLVKDNFSSRHLVLAVEEALVNYLQEDSSPDGILELEPMSSYNRLILHRLADIFGFAHESVGEGDDRHLVLQRCAETAIPSILVSDILWQHEACESPSMPYQLLRRDETSTVLKMDIASSPNFLKREAAYLAARERIFGIEELESQEATRQKPRHDPVVARRMIAHALGQRIIRSSHVKDDDSGPSHQPLDVSDIERKIKVNLDLHQETSPNSSCYGNKNVRAFSGEASTPDEKLSQRASDTKASKSGARPGGRDALGVSKMRMREENLGAAKRIFAHALGIPVSKEVVPRCGEVKTTTTE